MDDKCLRASKERQKLTASILLPLIEFEFSFIAEESPVLVQSSRNRNQLNTIFEVCKAHGWASKKFVKRENIGFKLHRNAFREIYSIAGEFAEPIKNQWAKLLLEREGMKGGFMRNKASTKEKIVALIRKNDKWWSIGELCLGLRLMPSTIRETLRDLESARSVARKNEGKRILWKYEDSSLETSPGKTVE
ncbi:MAG: hypothetical protein HYW26_01465 [Candidatus Aenigmarchaeota archaeon]|nr:hypothetical protein [Candidatus Aenigmarchaeota archaeon]